MRCEETNSPTTISPKHTFQGAFFIPSLSLCSARRSHKVEAVPETAGSPSPLKKLFVPGWHFLLISSAIPHLHRLAFASRDLPWGVFCPGNTKLFSFLEIR